MPHPKSQVSFLIVTGYTHRLVTGYSHGGLTFSDVFTRPSVSPASSTTSIKMVMERTEDTDEHNPIHF